jgi:hypothetical protein
VTGGCDWRLRFSPTKVGAYTVKIRVKTPEQTIVYDAPGFRCRESGRRGFIRVAKDDRHFEHTTGEFFYPLGPVVRSPTDTRDAKRDPTIVDRMRAANWRGTYQFDDYLGALSKGGGNWIRMWLCSWWCGLEWYRKWPGYGGAGWYNMQNAWRVDHVLEAAAREGVYVQLCLQNHGQTSEHIDHEWEYNPYNRYEPDAFINKDVRDKTVRPRTTAPAFRRPGGWLEDARAFYSDKRVRKMKKKLYRYIIARWGYSPNVFAWVLSSEVEFTGEYWKVQYKSDQHDMSSGKWRHNGVDRAVNTVDYHREMAVWFKEADPFRHVVSTHFSNPIRGRGVWHLDEMEFTQSNAYSAFGGRRVRWFRGHIHPNDCMEVPGVMRQYCSRFMGPYRKPVLIGEWGGYWMRNSCNFLDAELHSGTWVTVMTPMAGSTGFWWWTHVHFRDRYGVFRAVRNFMEGEDRRGLKLKQLKATLVDRKGEPVPGLQALVLGSKKRADAYVYHLSHTYKLDSAPVIDRATLALPGLEPGRYVVELWDTRKGKVTRRAGARVSADGLLRFDLKKVAGDVALKVRSDR